MSNLFPYPSKQEGKGNQFLEELDAEQREVSKGRWKLKWGGESATRIRGHPLLLWSRGLWAAQELGS